MRIHVLGSSAGGGLPQWNCGGPYSVRARSADPDVPPRTQPSLAISADGKRWSLINASPDIRDQFARFSGLHPTPGTRELPLDTVVITNADLDHTLGLLVLRESLCYRVVSTPWVRETVLGHNAAWRLMESVWKPAALEETFAIDPKGALEGFLFPVPGKVPSYLSGLASNHPEATVGLRITDTRSGKRLVYAPGIQSLDPATTAALAAADCRFVDGTFFDAQELRALRPEAPDAHQMGHLPVGGEGGTLERLAKLPGRSIYIHMNNTNPILDAGSKETALVRSRGVEIAWDGMEIEL